MKTLKNWIDTHKKEILTYFYLFICMFVLTRANVMHKIYPFAFGFLFALVYLNKNIIILSPIYITSMIIKNPTLQSIIIAISTVSVAILAFLIFKFAKKRMPLYIALIFCALSQTGFLYFNINTTYQILISFVSILVGLCFMYIAQIAFSAIFYRGLQSRFTTDESICFGLFFIAFFSGLCGLYIGTVNISFLITVFAILCISRFLTKSATIYFAAIAGLGFSFVNSSVISIAIFAIYGLICACFSQNTRIFPSILVVLSDCVFGLFLNAYAQYNYINLLAIFVCVLLFLCVPNSLFNYLRGLSFSYDGQLASDFMILGKQEDFKNKLIELSSLFRLMQVEYRNLSIGDVNKVEYCEMLTDEITSRHCAYCINKDVCIENPQIKEAISQLINFGIEKGKVTILDANNLLMGTCKDISSLICEVNVAIKTYFEYQEKVNASDQGKMLVSSQMGATGKIFDELASNIAQDDMLDHKNAKIVIDGLTQAKIVVNECVVICGNQGVKQVVLVVRNSDIVRPEICSVLKDVFGINFSLIKQTFAHFAGWSILLYKPADKYKIAVGYAQKAKDGINGDTYACKKFSNGRYLFAIADGKGHGEKARMLSSAALSVVESFYKTGISSETVISSVNKLMLPAGEENFTTLDICVLDLAKGQADFVKIGSAVSVIKSGKQTSIISSDSLPLAAVKNLYPKIEKRILKIGDIVVLASDGVVDAFTSPESYADFVNNEMVINVQMLAENILEEAESRSSHADDMTVIAIKLNQNFA